MQFVGSVAVAVLCVSCAWAQSGRYHVNPGTPEGKLLQQAGEESDEARKIALYEEFIAKYPQHEGVAYAWGQAQPFMLKAKMLDKVIQAAEAVFVAEPDNPVAAYNGLQACEQKGDAACILQWAGRTVEAARKKLASKKPEAADEAETWARETDWSTQVITRCEYAYYAASLKFSEPKSIAAFYEALEKVNPDSQYIGQTGGRYFIALLQMKEMQKAQQFGEKAAEHDLANEDMLLYIADANLTTTKDYDKAIGYAGKIIDALPAQSAPQGMAAADWEAKKQATLGRASWIAGTAHCVKESWANCDKALRLALPLIEGSPAGKDLLPGAYFYLGLANYNLSKATAKRDAARTAEARKYFTACSKIPGPFQAPAVKNLGAMAAGK